MIVIFLLFCCVAAAQEPCWPLDMPTRYLTGNFMEPRDGAYHAGLDLKTNSQTGYPVLAVEDGHISRVRMSAGGYGQAIYLTAADGTVYVYGHLDRLRDDLRREVRARQSMEGGYEVDLWFKPHEWPVKRAEVLALSGQSATLGPHLHFEVRGPDGQPRDPLAHGFAVDDKITPEILAVRAVRDGGPERGSMLLGAGKKPLKGRLPDLQLGPGPLFFSALIIERSDRQRHLLGPWRVRLLANGREVYAAVNDSLRWDYRQHQRLEFVRTALGQEQWLRVDGRNRLAGRQAAAWLSEGLWPAGRHELELVAEDRAGNRSSVSWTLIIEEHSLAGGNGRIAPDGREHAPAAKPYVAWRPDVDVLRDPWLVDTDAAGLVAGTLPHAGLAWIAAPLLQTVSTRFWRLSGLEALGQPVQYRLEDDWALMQTVAVELPEIVLPPADIALDPTVGVYRLQRRAWRHAGSLRAGSDGPLYDLRRPGIYKVMRDRSPPLIAKAGVPAVLEKQPIRERGGITLPAWPILKIPVGDHGSGVDWATLAVSLEGRRLIAEPDPPRDRILVELPDTLEPGPRLLAISVADRAGNIAGAELRLSLLDPASEPDCESFGVDGVAAPSP